MSTALDDTLLYVRHRVLPPASRSYPAHHLCKYTALPDNDPGKRPEDSLTNSLFSELRSSSENVSASSENERISSSSGSSTTGAIQNTDSSSTPPEADRLTAELERKAKRRKVVRSTDVWVDLPLPRGVEPLFHRLPPPPTADSTVQTPDALLICRHCQRKGLSHHSVEGSSSTPPHSPPPSQLQQRQPHADVILVNSTLNIRHGHSFYRGMFEEMLLATPGFTVRKLTSSSAGGDNLLYTAVGGGFRGLCEAAEDTVTSAFLDIRRERTKKEAEVDENPGLIDRFWDFFETDQEVDYISAPFRWDKKDLFAGIEDPDTFFRSSLRSYLTHHILIRTDVSKKKDTQDGINIRGLNYLKLKGVYTDVFILHDRPSYLHRRHAFKEKDEDNKLVDPRQELWDSWKLWYKFQPLWKIRNYFGEKIAFYFAWIELYTQTLIWPTLIGLIIFFYGIYYKSKSGSKFTISESISTTIYEVFTIFNNPATPFFSLILCLWGTIFVEQWKRKSNSLKYEWDVSNFEQLEPDRPQFYGSKTRKNPITEEEEWFYPFYRLYLKLSFSVTTLLFMVTLVIGSTIGVIIFRIVSTSEDFLGEYKSIYSSVISSVLNASAIMLLGYVYEKIAYWLTDWENHRTQTNYDDSLIIKLFAFQFVNNYASLIYIAFFKQSVSENGAFGRSNWTDTCDYSVNVSTDGGITYTTQPQCFPMLVLQVAVLLCMKPMPKFFKDVVIPAALHYFRKWSNSKKNGDVEATAVGTGHAKELIDIIEEDRKLISGDNDFTLSEYTEKCIMYGFIMLFGAVFPLAPLVALLCNVIDVRIDGYRILWKNRRYIAQRAEDIGIWQYILEFLNMIGVVVNSLIIAHTLNNNGSFLQNIENKWLIAFAFEHVCFVVKFIISYIIPDVPSDVQFKMRKEQFQVNQLFEKGIAKKSPQGTPNNNTGNADNAV